MEEPRAKRTKIARGDDDYMPGNIIEIELHNFMTFTHLKCKPGSRLNLVIGPNGSGKSSIVCAIALGLGGEPQLLGRATSVGAYVKRGEESGYVKISLRGETKEEPINIMRKIDTRNKSEWLFNGKVVPKKDIAEITKRFNIQVGNLTQFLPQDRVSEFAKLNPVKLLEETEKAVGDPQLPIRHYALVDKSKELKILERTIETNQSTLDQHKSHVAVQQREVERVRQREELLEKAKTMAKKLPWLKYDIKQAEYLELKEREKEAKKKVEDAARKLKDLSEPIKRQKQEKAKMDAKFKEVERFLNNNSNKRAKAMEVAEQLGIQVEGKYKQMEDLRKEEESRQQRILEVKEDLAAAELEFQSLPPYEPPKGEIERLATQIVELELSFNEKRDLKVETEKALNQKQGMLRQCVGRLKEMQNKNNKLLQALKNSGVDKVFEAYNWVQEHRHEFKKEVYGPVLLEVNVSDKRHANYLEDHVAYYIWKSFITQDSSDRDLLFKSLKCFDVPVLNYIGSENSRADMFQISQKMNELGIYSRLDQVFDAPIAVKEVLTSQSGLDRSYIGSKNTDMKADEVPKLGIFDCWTPDNHYRWVKSRYGNHVSASVDAVGRSLLLLCGSDTGEIESLRCKKKDLEESIAHLEEIIRSAQIEKRNIEDEAAELRRTREEIVNAAQRQKRVLREKENLINQRKRRLEALERQDDLDTSLAKLADEAEECNVERFNCTIQLRNLFVEAVSLRQTLVGLPMASIEFDVKIKESEANLKQHQNAAIQATINLEECKKEVLNFREQLLQAKKYAESVAVITPQIEKEFLEMPSTIEELEAAIQDCKSEANSILCLNRNVLEEYEHRLSQIQSLSTKLEADREKLNQLIADIDELKESWLQKLRSLVDRINQTFSRNFQEMAVAGEVSLEEHEIDFDRFGILIKVKFRQTGELQVLSAHHQSGGERSVSTILYLVSLQDLTHCPFRVVDEINQGMDPINERKMFQQLVRAASQPNTPQCFLLTPKLLPELQYSEACSILNIMNGPWLEQPTKVWSGGDCWRSITGMVAEQTTS